ncbi:APC family permease [Staphylococcus aureus]
MGSFFNKIARKEDPAIYQNKDGHLKCSILGARYFLALGVGRIESTSIFTLPGIVAAEHAGPAVALSFLLAAIVAGLVAFTYAEMAAAMPFAGSAYSWVNVLFGEFFGWVAGWALLAEYFIAVAFVASGSANLRGLCETNWHRITCSIIKSIWYEWRFYRYYCCYRYFINCIITITWYVRSSTYGKHFSYFKKY